MEVAVVWVFQGDIVKPLIGDYAVADDLNLGLVRNSFQIWVEDGSLSIERLAVSVGAYGRIEALRDIELGFWSYMRLVLEDKDLMVEQSIADDLKVCIYTSC